MQVHPTTWVFIPGYRGGIAISFGVLCGKPPSQKDWIRNLYGIPRLITLDEPCGVDRKTSDNGAPLGPWENVRVRRPPYGALQNPIGKAKGLTRQLKWFFRTLFPFDEQSPGDIA